MAVREAVPTMEQTEEPSKLAQWSGMIALIVYAVLGMVVVAIVILFATTHVETSKVNELRGYWDEYYLATKDAKEPQEVIVAVEGVWDKISGTPVQPFAAMELAQLHFNHASNADVSPASREEALAKVRKLYDLAFEKWSEHKVLGALALEGAALCREQARDYEGAAELASKNVEAYKLHFRYDKLCYDTARYHWLQGLKNKAEEKSYAKDFKEARAWLKKALGDVGSRNDFGNSWQREAEYLQVMVAEHGPALSDGKIPPQLPNPEVEELNKAKEEAQQQAQERAAEGAGKTEVVKKTEKTDKTEEAAKTEPVEKTGKTE